jgi:hypothetical protein
MEIHIVRAIAWTIDAKANAARETQISHDERSDSLAKVTGMARKTTSN